MQLEPLRRPESGPSVQSDRGLVACRHHDVSRVLPPPPDLMEESVHQEDPDSHVRALPDRRQRPAVPRRRAVSLVAVAKGLHHPAPGAKKPASTGERSGDTISQHE